MEIEKKGNDLFVKIKLRSREMYKITEGKTFRGVSVYKTPQICLGYSSKTEDNKHILLLDYDNVLKSVVIDDIRTITKLFSLPPAYLFTTGETEENGDIIGNYHCVILQKFTCKKAFEIMGHTSIDSNFKDSPLRKSSHSWVLRVGEKKGSGNVRFLEIIRNKNLNKEISTAHKKLLSKFFSINHPKYRFEDSLDKVNLQMYETKG